MVEMPEKGRLFSLRSGEKTRPFLSTKTVGNKYKDTFTSASSLGRAPRQDTGEALISLRVSVAFVKISCGRPCLLTVFRLSVCSCSTATHDPIPVSAARSDTRGRPPFGFGGSGGISGAIRAHNASGNSSFAMATPRHNYRYIYG